MKAPGIGRLVLGLAVLVVASAVVAAFMILGSPAEQRLLRFDERRIEDLNSLRFSVDGFWRANRRLPASLEEAVRREAATAVVPADPETGEAYGYRVLGEQQFELCATFARELSAETGGLAPQPWLHPAGRHCFSLEPRTRSEGFGQPR